VRGDSASMTVFTPRDAAEAVRLAAERPDASPLAGGTDFMVGWNAGLSNGRAVLDLWGLSEWKRIEASKQGVRLGALVTHAQLQAHPVLRRDFPLLVQACATVGAAQIQNRGTIGGNIANASPAADTFPPLAVYEAVVHAVSARGRRAVPFSEVFAGVKKTTLAPGELIEAVELPALASKPSRGFFRKVGARAAQTISKTMGAGLLWLEPGKGRKAAPVVMRARLAFGSVAPTVRRLKTVEAFLQGCALDEATIEEAVALVDRDVSPIDDIRSTAQYRLAVTRNIVRAFLVG
jgi:xanthine dehydrogenase small subunit